MDPFIKKNLDITQEVTLLIVCYNSEKLVKQNLDELKLFPTIIIDNSNSKKTFDLVKNISNISYIKTNKNLGYGKANNLGAKHVKTPYIMVLNPDILIYKRSIEILYKKYFQYKNVGILAPSLYDIDNKRRTNGSLSRLKKNISKIKNIKDRNIAEGDTCYDFVVGCSLFMSQNFFESIGGFDEDFFMYFEDNDLCDRVHKKNMAVIEVPESKMIHMQGLSSKIDLLTNIKLSIIHKVSEYIYYKKNFSFLKLQMIIFKHFFDYLQRSIVNLFLFRFKNFFKNLLRLISIILYITRIYKIIY